MVNFTFQPDNLCRECAWSIHTMTGVFKEKASNVIHTPNAFSDQLLIEFYFLSTQMASRVQDPLFWGSVKFLLGSCWHSVFLQVQIVFKGQKQILFYLKSAQLASISPVIDSFKNSINYINVGISYSIVFTEFLFRSESFLQTSGCFPRYSDWRTCAFHD